MWKLGLEFEPFLARQTFSVCIMHMIFEYFVQKRIMIFLLILVPSWRCQHNKHRKRNTMPLPNFCSYYEHWSCWKERRVFNCSLSMQQVPGSIYPLWNDSSTLKKGTATIDHWINHNFKMRLYSTTGLLINSHFGAFFPYPIYVGRLSYYRTFPISGRVRKTRALASMHHDRSAG